MAQEVPEELNFNMLPRDCSCDILVKNVAAFCSCLKTLPEAKVKRFELILLAEEISEQPSIEYSFVWLLVVILMKIYNEEEQENVKFEEKRSTRKQNGVKSCIQGDKQIKKWNKGNGDLRERSHPAIPSCEKELKS